MRKLLSVLVLILSVSCLISIASTAGAQNYDPNPTRSWGCPFPKGIAIYNDVVYVVDSFNHHVMKYDLWGNPPPSGESKMLIPPVGANFWPSFIAIDPSSGNFYFTDDTYNKVYKFNGTSWAPNPWGGYGGFNSAGGKFNGPKGIALDPSGNVYVADSGNHRIQKLDSTSGTWEVPWATSDPNGSIAPGQFDYPYGIAFDPSGTNMYVGDGSHRVQQFVNGSYFALIGQGQFDQPYNIAADPSGNAYVADNVKCLIQKFDPNGTRVDSWGGLGSGAGKFLHPEGIAFDQYGFIYVADYSNSRVQKFGPQGVEEPTTSSTTTTTSTTSTSTSTTTTTTKAATSTTTASSATTSLGSGQASTSTTTTKKPVTTTFRQPSNRVTPLTFPNVTRKIKIPSYKLNTQ